MCCRLANENVQLSFGSMRFVIGYYSCTTLNRINKVGYALEFEGNLNL
jgi:hypothetical protein